MSTISPVRHNASRGRARNAEQSRQGILRAAMDEFAREGIAGARIDFIARAAGVNKALLYYYFEDKERLYGEVLDYVFSQLTSRVFPVLDSDLPPREKIVRYVQTYFDAVASVPEVPRILQQEMMRAGRDGSPHLQRIGKKYISPLALRVQALLRDGIARREFRPVDPQHFALTIAASVVFYFTCAPMLRAVLHFDPLASSRVVERRAAVLDFLTHALFADVSTTRRRVSARQRSARKRSL